jgi:hypothetical protein
LNNEMDRMIHTQDRLQKEFDAMQQKYLEMKNSFQADNEEKSHLVMTCKDQIGVVQKLVDKCESYKRNNAQLIFRLNANNIAQERLMKLREDNKSVNYKLGLMQQYCHYLDSQRHALDGELNQLKSHHNRLLRTIKTLKLTIKSAMRTVKPDEDVAFRESQRKNLLINLLKIITDIDSKMQTASIESMKSITDLYRLGDLGISPQPSRTRLVKKSIVPEKLSDVLKKSLEMTPSHTELSINEIIDVLSGSQLILSEPEKEETSIEDEESETTDDDQFSSTSKLKADVVVKRESTMQAAIEQQKEDGDEVVEEEIMEQTGEDVIVDVDEEIEEKLEEDINEEEE